MHEKTVLSIIKYGEMLESSRLTGEKSRIGVRLNDNSMMLTAEGAKLNALSAADIKVVKFDGGEEVRYAQIFAARADINCIMHMQPFNASTCADARVTIPPVLDDMSQIVGVNIKTAADNSADAIVKALKGRNGCLVEGEGMITSGRSLDEAYTACLVLEKAAKTFIEATAVGGSVKLGWLDANLQRLVYKKKYSKQNQESKMEELTGGK